MDIIFGFYYIYMCKVKGFESDSSHYVEACLFFWFCMIVKLSKSNAVLEPSIRIKRGTAQ